MSRSRRPGRAAAGVAAATLLLGACATAPDRTPPTDPAGSAGPGSIADVAGFCASAASLADGTVLGELDLTDLGNRSAGDPSLDAAVDAVTALGSVTAPEEIAEQWRAVVAPLADLLQTLRDADVTTRAGADEVRTRTDALVDPEVVEAGEVIDAYVAEHC
ncbi:hypothetical protein [Sanguibacter sp. 25GB23B1]|uniref:hypothetical protein n=1 Tax=unclassified Sanguibacter TaxID=2645534 RepID=UPI0032AF555C